MSRLDYGNAMLYGLSETQLRKLQMVQNSAARLTTGTKRRDHIILVLYCLHWLPVHLFCTVYTGCLYTCSVPSTLAACTPVLYRLHWLPVHLFCTVYTGCLYTSVLYSNCILIIARDTLHADQITSIGRTRSMTVLRYHWERYGRRWFSVAETILWNVLRHAVRNALRHAVRNADSVATFKTLLKTHNFVPTGLRATLHFAAVIPSDILAIHFIYVFMMFL